MDWLELIIFLLLISAGLLFGDKKKQRERPAPRRREPPPRRQTPRAEPVRTPREPSVDEAPAEEALTAAEAVFEQIRRRMEMEAERISRPELTAPPAAPAAPAASTETLTPAGGESHERFHESYIEEPKPPEDWGKRRLHRARISPRSAREAMIWGAIFGKPKGMGG